MAKNKKITMSKKSIIGVIIGAVVSIVGIVITIVTSFKKKKKPQLKEHATKYKPI